MKDEADLSVLPRWRVTRWLVHPGRDVPPDIQASLVAGLYGSLPIFLGGVFNTLAVSTVIAGRIATLPFLIWAGVELALSAIRLCVLITGRNAIAAGRPAPTDLYILLALGWAAAIGYGTFISIASGDWVAASLACLSAAAMVGGICFRNFGAPRLAGVMVLLSLGPCAVAAIASGEPILLVIAFQVPFYLASMCLAAFHLSRMLVTTMRAERANERRACQDPLTGLLNRAGLEHRIGEWARRDARPITLFYLDLDGFKAINDRLGHAAGDSLLTALAERLRGMVRDEDAVARIGGDEFVIVSRSLDRPGASRVGERIVAEVGNRGYVIGLRSINVGVSVGIAMSGEGSTLESLLAAADAALYRAKSEGRARYAMAPAPERRAA